MGKETRTFKDLEVWQKGRELRKDISNLTKSLPKEEQYLLVNQMIRASRSVTANISEGYGRFHYQENIQFCRQARGSLFELLDHLTVAFDEDYIKDNELVKFKEQVLELIRMLNGYINYLNRKKNEED